MAFLVLTTLRALFGQYSPRQNDGVAAAAMYLAHRVRHVLGPLDRDLRHQVGIRCSPRASSSSSVSPSPSWGRRSSSGTPPAAATSAPSRWGWKGGVGDHVAYVVLMGLGVVAMTISFVIVAFRDADPAAQAHYLGVDSVVPTTARHRLAVAGRGCVRCGRDGARPRPQHRSSSSPA